MITDEEFKKVKEELEVLKKSFEEHISKIPKESEKISSNEEKIQKLAQEAGISVEDLKKVFDFDGDELHLICTFGEEKLEENQLNSSLTYLTGMNYYLNRSELLAKNLRSTIENLGISLSNFSTNLQEHRNFIIKKGMEKSPKTSYKITALGLKRGLEIIKELAGK